MDQRYNCQICAYETSAPNPSDLGVARGNTRRFSGKVFRLWQCPRCQSIHTIDDVDFEDIYKDYPLNYRRLDLFASATLRNLIRRLERSGLQRSHSILDYGCGNGLLIRLLKNKGYSGVKGFDPYVGEFRELPGLSFDYVIANDVIEHCPSPRQMIYDCMKRLKPGGILYIGTADTRGVKMSNLEPHIMRLHLPFHRVIIAEKSLHGLAVDCGLELLRWYRRSYMDTLIPFANYRFLDEFSKALGHDMEGALDPASSKVIFQKPRLVIFGLVGYFFPCAYEPAVILRKPLLQK